MSRYLEAYGDTRRGAAKTPAHQAQSHVDDYNGPFLSASSPCCPIAPAWLHNPRLPGRNCMTRAGQHHGRQLARTRDCRHAGDRHPRDCQLVVQMGRCITGVNNADTSSINSSPDAGSGHSWHRRPHDRRGQTTRAGDRQSFSPWPACSRRSNASASPSTVTFWASNCSIKGAAGS